MISETKLAVVDTFLAGQRFGRYQVVKVVRERGRSKVLCICDCGTERLIAPYNLVSGNSRSCGCLKRDTTTERNTRHGMAGSKIYNIWADMVGRCTRPTHARYADYGGRGIRVCERWRDFVHFYEDMGERPKGRSLDRINNDAGYSPENCRWATANEQRQNRRAQRRRTHCEQGHEYTDENTRRTPAGKRQCRACSREYARQARLRKRSKSVGGSAT